MESKMVSTHHPQGGDGERMASQAVECPVADSLWKRILRLIFPDQRKQVRLPMPPLVGYLGTANASKPYELGDISLTGFSLRTAERWIPGTEMPITLQQVPAQEDSYSFTVQATVVRWDEKGVGFSILLSEEGSNAVYGNPLRAKWMTRPQMVQYLDHLRAQAIEELPDSHSQNPGKAPVGTQAGSQTSLEPALIGGR